MKQIMDQSVLILYCLTALLFVPADTAFVIGFLTALIYVSVSNVGYFKRYNLIFTVFFLISAYICPQCLIFTPAVLYEILENKCYHLSAVLAVLCIFFYGDDRFPFLIHTAAGTLISALLWYRTSRYEALFYLFKKTRDDSTEKNLLLEEKNQTLIEKQDYEVYTATLKERNRIAREIHDHVGHMLSRAILMVGAMKTVNKEAAVKEALNSLEDTLNTAMTNVRESVHDLHDDSVDLKDVLEGVAGEYRFCPVQLKYDMGYRVPREIKYGFIAIVKEALNNVEKHSDATGVFIMVREHPALYQLMIEDNGSKKNRENMERMEEAPRGIGIGNMKDRVRALGGRIQIERKKGFRIFITVPKKEEAE